MQGLVYAIALLLLGDPASAASFDEAVDGDLANDRLVPSHLGLATGSNVVRGGYGRPDLDYLHVHVPTGSHLSGIMALPGTTVGGGRAFIGVQHGTLFSVASDSAEPADLLGYTHIDFVFSPRDLLVEMGAGFGAQGFSGPLPAGDYTFWIQELAPGSYTFALDFVLTSDAAELPARQVPAAPYWLFALLAGGLLHSGTARLARLAPDDRPVP